MYDNNGFSFVCPSNHSIVVMDFLFYAFYDVCLSFVYGIVGVIVADLS